VTKTKTTDIKLREAQAKFTRLKSEHDGSAKTEKAYQKAKTALAMARQAHAETRPTRVSGPSRASGGNGTATIEAVAVKTGTKE